MDIGSHSWLRGITNRLLQYVEEDISSKEFQHNVILLPGRRTSRLMYSYSTMCTSRCRVFLCETESVVSATLEVLNLEKPNLGVGDPGELLSDRRIGRAKLRLHRSRSRSQLECVMDVISRLELDATVELRCDLVCRNPDIVRGDDRERRPTLPLGQHGRGGWRRRYGVVRIDREVAG
jgi:hypothetical protein